jgi:hypothetical protein
VRSKGSLLALIGFCCAAVVIVAMVFATLFAGAAVAFTEPSVDSEQAEQTTASQPVAPNADKEKSDTSAKSFSGMVTDSHCMGRHVKYPDKSPGECAKMCARNGSTYLLVDGDKKYVLQGGDMALDRVAAQRAVVSGTLDGDTIKVASATAQ